MSNYTGLEIAVIGMAGQFPGAADIEQFWENLKNGVESITRLADKDILDEGEDKNILQDPFYVRAGAFVSGKEYFDADFFGYRPGEARIMEPQIRLFHESCWKAMEDAGYDLARVKDKIGVFAGATSNYNWEVFSILANRQNDVDDFTASQLRNVNYLCSRVAYQMNLQGPVMFINTACSTSLVTIERAVMSLILRECNMALAGGVTINNYTHQGYVYKEGMILSKDGHCRPFDSEASGTVAGEGIGVVVLKRLADAIKDRDNIYAVIRGAAVNNDGRQKVSFTAPSPNGQYLCVLKAINMARIQPESISYVEAHGTGTLLGDPIEVEALNRVFGESSKKYCALGSVKGNVGHLDSAAGVTGFIKTVLSLYNRKIPASLHFKNGNPEIDFSGSALYVNSELREWTSDKNPLRAGVSSFGIGGTNAHIILEEAPMSEASSAGRACQVLVFSAKTINSLKRYTAKMSEYLLRSKSADLADIAYTLHVGRTHFRYRKAVVCNSVEDAVAKIQALTGFDDIAAIPEKRRKKLVFMFPGQGAQYRQMGQGLYKQEAFFRSIADDCFAIVNRINGIDLKKILFSTEPGTADLIDQTEYTQPLLFIVEYSIARLLQKWGINPDVMIGHSIGEYVAACISGVFTLEDCLSLVLKRGSLMQQAQRGVMLSISIKEHELRLLLANYPEVSLAAINSTELCVVSGEAIAIENFKNALERSDINCKIIRTSHAFHSHMMDGVMVDFIQEVRKITVHTAAIPFISNLTGNYITKNEFADPVYWGRHLREAVQYRGGIDTLLHNGELIFIEAGPGRSLAGFVRSHEQYTHEHKVINLVRHAQEESVDDLARLLKGLGDLWMEGVEPSWDGFYENEVRNRISIPTYEFEKIKYPVNVNAGRILSVMIGDTTTKNKDISGWFPDNSGEAPWNENGMDLLAIPDDQSNKLDVESSTIQKLSVIWQQFFGKEAVRTDDDFFESGGDSLKALTIINRISKAFRVNISIKDFFNHTTIAKLAAYIDSKNETAGLSQNQLAVGDIPPCPLKPYYKLSAAQKRLYFLHEYDKSLLAYNMPRFIHLDGDLDADHLNCVVEKLVLRHDSLRTSFVLVEGELWQKITDQTTLGIEYYKGNGEDIQDKIREFIRPFDLSKGPLLRVGLLRISARRHLLMVDIHHIINDGVSENILIKDFLSLYRGETLPALPLQYKDYAEWQQSSRERERIAAQKAFWLNEFSEDVTPLDLPFDHSRPAVKSEQGDCINFSLNAIQTAALRSMASSEGVSMFMVLLALYNVLLSKLSNQEDIVIGIPTAGRQHADLEGIIGMFVNTLPVRNYPKGSISFKELLAAVKVKTLSALQHQEYQYEDLIDALQVSRDMSRNPLFDVVLSYQNYEESSLELPGVTISAYNQEQPASKFDLNLVVWESNDQLQLSFEYCTALFREKTLRRFAAYLQQIVNTVIKDTAIRIADIEVIDSDEKHRLLYDLDHTAVAYPQQETIVSLFNKQVEHFPQKIAVELDGRQISYKQLDEKSNQVAWWLRRQGVGAGSIVALLTDRSIDTITGMLAIVKAGGAYLPIDVDYPAERIQYMLTDSEAGILLTTHKEFTTINENLPSLWLQDERIGSYSVEAPEHINQPDDTCYIIYTSGTTGRPKGVMITHRNVVRLLYNASFGFAFSENDVWTMFHSHCFDFSVWEMYGALLYGGKLIIIPKDIAKDPVLYLKTVKDKAVTVVNQTPSAFYNLIQADEQEPQGELKVRYVIFGGEALHPGKLKDWYAKYPQVKLINMYGITETTVHVTYKEIGEAEIAKNISNIGVPIPTLSAYVFDRYGKLVPAGVKGELYVGGAGVGRGYLNREELTKQRFIDNPYKPGERLYRSGDLVKLTASGELEYAGRIDEQVKIRGYRIELGEIEQQLNTHADIKETVVVVREREGNKYLVAYYVSAVKSDGDALRNYLLQRLPDYMVPSFFVHLQQLPLTSNGKLDRKALPEPTITGGEEYMAPATPEQALLSDIWSKVLGVERIGINDNFFSAGGDSIKSIQIIARVRTAGYELTVKDIFTSQTIALLCRRLKRMERVADQSMVTGESLLSPVQHWFFEKHNERQHHYNQAVMLHFKEGIDVEMVRSIFDKLLDHHDGLRTVFKPMTAGRKAMIVPASQLKASITEFDFRGKTDALKALTEACNEVQSGIDLANGPLMRLGLFHLDDGSRLLIAVHHLVIDGISWRILFEDIEMLFQQAVRQEKMSLPLKTASFRDWVSLLHEYSHSKGFIEAMEYWKLVMNSQLLPIARDNEAGLNRVQDRATMGFALNKEMTGMLLTRAHKAYRTQINDILMAGLLAALHRSFGLQQVKVDMEGHGREPVAEGVNISRTVGWFTSIYPVILQHKDGNPGRLLKHIKETLRRIPNNGIDYLIGRYITNVEDVESNENDARIMFNYLGQFDADTQNRSYTIAQENAGAIIAAGSQCAHDWEIIGMVVSGELKINIHYSRNQYMAETIEKLMATYQEELVIIIEHCCGCMPGELTPSDLTYDKLSIGQLDDLQVQYGIDDIYPLSPMQEGMLFHSLLNTASEMYFEQVMYRWEGDLDKDAVRRCVEHIMQRYDVLRTRFVHEGYGRPLQIVLKNANAQYVYKDIREELKAERSELIIRSYQEEDRQRRFDLSKDVLMRLTILRTGTLQYEFIWSHHHILMDGWCMGLIIDDFRRMYKSEIDAKRLMLEPAPRYAGYIKWLEKRDKVQSFNYWRSYLEDYDAIPVFPGKRPVTRAKADNRFLKYRLSLGQELTGQLKILAMQCGATLNTVFQAAWGILLGKYNNLQDVVFGAVVSGRSAEVDGIEKMVGLFINTIPVRIKYEDPDTIGSLIGRIQEEALQAEPHHYNSLSEIQSMSARGRNLIDHIIVFENYPVSKELSEANTGTGYVITNVEAFEQTNYELSVMVMPGKTLEVEFHYNDARYDTDTIKTISLHLISIFGQLLDAGKRAADVELVTESERDVLLNYFNNTRVDYPQDVTIIDLFEEHVKRSPDSIAVCCGRRQVSYIQLNDMAESIAGTILEKASPGVNDTIAFMANPSIEMIAIMLAILKVGCAYVALSPEAPVIRNQLIFTDCRAKLLVVQKAVIEQRSDAAAIAGKNQLLIVDENADKAALAKPVNMQIDKKEALIYIIYTSGSTGMPKGVAVRMAGIINMVRFYHQAFSVKAGEKISQVANISFDASAFEIWPCLAGGGLLYIASPEIRLDAALMEEWLIANQIEITFQPPAIAERLLKRKEIMNRGTLKVMNVAGDILNYYPEEKLPFKLFNLYGPTEDSVWTTWNELRYDKTMYNYSIGKPIANKKVYVIDKHNKLLPIGIPGELCISGKGLAKGYLNNEILEKQKFINNPFEPGEVMYKTGDLAKWSHEGEIEFLGRIDTQVKIRGFRIEMGEIESGLKELEEIQETAVVVHGENEGRFLVAYYTSTQAINVQEIKKHLAQRLPDYMLPSLFIQLDKMPYSVSGKLDRKSLPAPVFEASSASMAPVNDVQKELVAIWSGILGIESGKIGITDNFFDIGGNSIRLMSMVEQLNSRFNTRLSVAGIFRFPEIRSIANYILDDRQNMVHDTDREEEGVEQLKKTLNVLNSIK